MNENSLAATPAVIEAAPAEPTPVHAPLVTWITEGLRAGLLLRPRVAGLQPTPLQLLALFCLLTLIEVGLGRLEVDGPAVFDFRAWLAPSWSTAALMLLLWALLPGQAPEKRSLQGLASWLALWFVAVVPAVLIYEPLAIAQTRGLAPTWLSDSGWFDLGVSVWTLAVALRMGWHFGLVRLRLSALAAGLMFIFTVNAWQFPASVHGSVRSPRMIVRAWC